MEELSITIKYRKLFLLQPSLQPSEQMYLPQQNKAIKGTTKHMMSAVSPSQAVRFWLLNNE